MFSIEWAAKASSSCSRNERIFFFSYSSRVTIDDAIRVEGRKKKNIPKHTKTRDIT